MKEEGRRKQKGKTKGVIGSRRHGIERKKVNQREKKRGGNDEKFYFGRDRKREGRRGRTETRKL